MINHLRERPNPRFQAIVTHLNEGIVVTGKFLKSCFIEGLPAVIEGRYTRKQAAVIIAGSLPAILGTMMIVLPGVLFPTPGHQAFYHFGSMLGGDPISLIPVGLGTVSSIIGLKIPIS